MSQENNLLVAASGTGGHIFPALAISKNLEDYWNIHWLGVRQRFDANFIPQKYDLSTVNIKTPKKKYFYSFSIFRYFNVNFSYNQDSKNKENKSSFYYRRIYISSHHYCCKDSKNTCNYS